MDDNKKLSEKTPLSHIISYSIGEGANSMAVNGIANFAMLYYTKVLGLSATYAGLALSITLVLDAFMDPVMGHITDNTRSRFGRRHQYILIGGLLLAVSSFFLWFVPDVFSKPKILFWYLLAVNLLVRAASTVFVVPYTALGFEICTDYEGRSRLQSVRYFSNQIFNFLGGAMAWVLFFPDRVNPDGSRLDGTNIANNYYHAGFTLALASVAVIVICVFFTRRYAVDTRKNLSVHNNAGAFVRDFCETISDKRAVQVFACFAVMNLGMFLVSQVQMFTYVDFMKFTAIHKTCVHGAGMIAFALGSLLQARLVEWFDKKPAAYFGIGTCVVSNVMLLILFIGGILPPETYRVVLGFNLPVSVILFGIFQAMWWGGCGMLIPLSMSMIADISEINRYKTGVLKDGSYSAVFSFVIKAAMGIGMLINGWLLDLVGYVKGTETQIAETARKIAVLTFICGPIVMLLALPLIFTYPVNRAFMADIKAKLAKKNQRLLN
jgi:GPH family glycoside/pentoside/hexuronide:cation symporter